MGKKHLHLQIRPPAPRCGRFRSGGLLSWVVFLSGSRGRALAGHQASGAKAGHSRLSGPRMPFRGGRRRHTPQLRCCSESSRGTSGAGLRRLFLLWVVREEVSLHVGARTSGFRPPTKGKGMRQPHVKQRPSPAGAQLTIQHVRRLGVNEFQVPNPKRSQLPFKVLLGQPRLRPQFKADREYSRIWGGDAHRAH